MSTRRPHGTGGVYQRHDHPSCPPVDKKSGERPEHPCKGRWVGTVEAGISDKGTRRRLPVYGKTKSEAKAKLVEKQRAIARDGVPSASTTLTVQRWAERWLDTIVHTQRPKSFGTTKGSINKWVIPTIGRQRLDRLTRAHLRAVQDAQRQAGRSSATLRRTHTVLVKMLKDAQAEGHPVPASVLAMPAPEVGESDRTSLTPEHLAKMLAEVANAPDPSRWMGVLFQGLRPAELLGLTRECADLDDAMIDVSWQLQALPYIDNRNKHLGFRVPDGFVSRHLEGRWHLVRPKTRTGRRWVPMTPWFRAALIAWLEVAPESEHGLVWCRPDGGPLDPVDVLAEWKAMQRSAGVQHASASRESYVLHEGRHTTATLLRELGVSDDVLTAILGHASINSSRAYLHADVLQEAREAMSALHERVAGAPLAGVLEAGPRSDDREPVAGEVVEGDVEESPLGE
ncbi:MULTISPECIES: tyrosine-type recombinase/integrase [unclassified Aeromicrobium]|uniref:tyrosine-type recombinase/integrase n=1 Tax=unclassified Aeromicrobium TaxID=2633570 RepID=UPI00288B9EA9|nr:MULTISPECIES: tyrosine-type recombinase/integrase [unclassified Aeromicrobium]